MAVLDFSRTQSPAPPAISPPPGATQQVADTAGHWHWANALGQDLGLIDPRGGGKVSSPLDPATASPLSPPASHPMPHGADRKVWGSDNAWHWSDGRQDLGRVDDPGSWSWG